MSNQRPAGIAKSLGGGGLILALVIGIAATAGMLYWEANLIMWFWNDRIAALYGIQELPLRAAIIIPLLASMFAPSIPVRYGDKEAWDGHSWMWLVNRVIILSVVSVALWLTN